MNTAATNLTVSHAKQLVFCRREVQFNKIHPPYYHVYTISVLQKYKARRRDKNIFQIKTTNKARQQQNKKKQNNKKTIEQIRKTT